MKQHNSRMVVEVNKLIANALISDGGIYLPSIGSISIETTTPDSESAAPTRDIILRKEELFKSLVTVISERGNCTPQQAEQVYDRWLKIVVEDETTTIFGIGEIKDDKFITTSQMYNKLNPVQAAKSTPIIKVEPKAEPTPEPKPVVKPEPTPEPKEEPKPATPKRESTPKKSSINVEKKGKSGYAFAFIAAAAIAIGVTLFILTDNDDSYEAPTQIATNVEQNRPEEVATPETEQIAAVESTTQTTTPAKREINVNAEPTAILEQALMTNMSSTPKYKVVFGVYSSPSNAGRMIANVKKSTSGSNLDLRAYNYNNDKYLLTVFESNIPSECEAFRKSEVGMSISDDLWVYERK